ncbi:hypothetical protein, partial [Synechococcus sp. F70.1]|uniref:hypothetical protein n=1 Tax=Synechococcus sp. F70.1 TaxID=2964532 RepID=UPI0039C719B5
MLTKSVQLLLAHALIVHPIVQAFVAHTLRCAGGFIQGLVLGWCSMKELGFPRFSGAERFDAHDASLSGETLDKMLRLTSPPSKA